MVGSIKHLAEAIKLDLMKALPYKRKTQKKNLTLLIASMLHVKSVNAMDLAAELFLETDRIDICFRHIYPQIEGNIIFH